MSYQEIIDRIKPECDKVISFLEQEMSKIRTGRPSPSLVENIVVECFDQNMPLKQLGTITCSGARELAIQPWDKSYVEAIQKAISRSNTGASSVLDQDIIRVKFPPLTEDYRKSLIRILSEKKEEARATIRRWREDGWKEAQTGFQAGEIREDDKFKAKDKLQELVDEYNKKIEEMLKKKEEEILE